MKYFVLIPMILLISCGKKNVHTTEHFNHVDQVLWVVVDLGNVIANYENLGFREILLLDTVMAETGAADKPVPLRMAVTNLGGAHIVWIQPLEDQSIFARFHRDYGDGAMSLVHNLSDSRALKAELKRLSESGIEVLEQISVQTPGGTLDYTLMDTRKDGKYILGFTSGSSGDPLFRELSTDNLHHMKINQYAFAIREAEPVSEFWARLGQPEFSINYPELGNMHYYGEPTDHELIQGWQRHGSVAYEWCIPVKPPIVYDDHIRKHGEGIHHLAFTVQDMDQVLSDYESKGYVNSMGGTWGEEGKPGSGRYEYIDLEKAGGVTMELLWSCPSQD